MRRTLIVLALIALSLPVLGTAAARSPGDGTLAVRNAAGFIRIDARGAIIGRCDRCILTIIDLFNDDGGEPIVTGAETSRDLDEDGEVEQYRGTNIRFRLIGGKFLVRIERGRDVDLSAVGRGVVRLRGVAGTYSFNGEDPTPLPGEMTRFQLSAPPPPSE